jgi:LysR family transcriptional regulator, transcriptional activator of nhaA
MSSGFSNMFRSINYKHLHYFWAVARWGGITRAAERLHLTPQTLSGQIKQLETGLGVALFATVGKRLELTEAGRLAYSYADEMFSIGAELNEVLSALPDGRTQTLRVGIADSLPKSMAQRLLTPALRLSEPVRLICREGALEPLLADLALHRLDLLLSIRPVPQGLNVRSFNHRLGESAIGLFQATGAYNASTTTKPPAKRRAEAQQLAPQHAFPRNLHGQPWLLPGEDSPLRAHLLDWCESKRVVPRIVGEFDDTALMKAFGGAGIGLFPAPMVLRAEIERDYRATLLGVADGVRQQYYAISNQRRIAHPALGAIVGAASSWLADGTEPSSKKTKKPL